jgi:ADP-heptose:LPS heptosyltransferase
VKTCLVSRTGAFGDVMHCAHLPELIKKHYKVDRLDFDTSIRGKDILLNNPFIDNLKVLDMQYIATPELISRWQYQEDEYDLVFNLIHTIELKYCVLENDHRYFRNDKYRRERFGKMNYYDVMTEACGLPDEYLGTRGKLYYSDDCHEKAKNWIEGLRKKHNADWVVLVCTSGSSLHKRFQQVNSICKKILSRYPNALLVTTGGDEFLPEVDAHPRIIDKSYKWNFRTVALMAKYFDFVISPETGLVCVSHSWDTPTLQLLTAASPDNHIKYAKNAYCVKSPAYCSPCHKSPQMYYGCPQRDGYPLCVWFNEDEIMAKVTEAYERK